MEVRGSQAVYFVKISDNHGIDQFLVRAGDRGRGTRVPPKSGLSCNIFSVPRYNHNNYIQDKVPKLPLSHAPQIQGIV